MSLNVAQIIAEFGSVYIDGGQGTKDLQAKLMQPAETAQLFDILPTNSTKLHKATASQTRVLQQFQKAFTPVGGTTFELEAIELDHIKIDVAEFPDDIMPSWLGFLASGKLKREDWPLVKYWLEEMVIPKSIEDKEVFEIFKGVKTAIVPGTAHAQGASMNGIRKKIRDGNTAGKTEMITMGAIPTDPILCVNYIEDFVKQIPELHRNRLRAIATNKTVRDRFREGMRQKYNMNYQMVGSLLTIIDTSLPVVGVESMAGSEMIWTTIKGNAANPVKFPGNANVFDIQAAGREVKAMNDYWEGVGFWYLPYVYHTDRDLV